MARYFKNIEAMDEKKKADLKKMWEEVRVGNKETEAAKTTVAEQLAPKPKNNFRLFLGIFFGLLVVVAGFLTIWYVSFSKAMVAISVRDEKSNTLLTDVLVTIGDKEARTDAEGKARFDNLSLGEQTLRVAYAGYKENSKLINLKRGDNGEMEMTINLARITVAGVLLDKIDKKPVADASVSIGEATASSDTTGNFSVTNILPGKSTIKVTKDGYRDFSFELISSSREEENVGALRLTPVGSVIFGSNRDADQAVYRADFDGDELGKLWENIKGSDDSAPNLSPGQTKVLFYSTRDNERDSYGNLKAKLYYYDLDTKVSQKITSDEIYDRSLWIANANGEEMIYLTSEYNQNSYSSTYAIKDYTFSDNKLSNRLTDENFKTKEASETASISRLIQAAAPNGNQLAFNVYVRNPYGVTVTGDNRTGMYVMKADGSSLKKLGERQPSSEFKFSADGKSLIFDAYQSNSIKRYSVDIATGKETNIAFDEKYKGYYSQGGYESKEIVSPDGKKKAVIDYRDGKNDLYYANLDGSGEKRLSYTGGVDKAQFTASGRYILFSVSLANESALYILGLEGDGSPVKITDIYQGSFAGVLDE